MFRVYGFRIIIFMRNDFNIFGRFVFDLSICVYSERIVLYLPLQYFHESLVTSRCTEKEFKKEFME